MPGGRIGPGLLQDGHVVRPDLGDVAVVRQGGRLESYREEDGQRVMKAAESVGGRVESFYFAFGDTDAFVIADVPDHASAAAIALTVSAGGGAAVRTAVLLVQKEYAARLSAAAGSPEYGSLTLFARCLPRIVGNAGQLAQPRFVLDN